MCEVVHTCWPPKQNSVVDASTGFRCAVLKREESMASLFASWVPGYAAVAEWMGPALNFPARDARDNNPPVPDPVPQFSDVNGWRRAWGAFFTLPANGENWIHIPIPTPVLVEDKRATLGRVMALFRIDGGHLQRVLVFDGPNPILDRGGLDIGGDHAGGLDNSNTFDVNHDGIQWGVGFSLNFKSDGGLADLYIASAGGDFFHNI
jgi:hypothetical protein